MAAREEARRQARRDDGRHHSERERERSHIDPGDAAGDSGARREERGGSPTAVLSLGQMIDKLNQHGPLDTLFHVLVGVNGPCPFSATAVGKLRGMYCSMEGAGVKIMVGVHPLGDLLALAKPCKGHAKDGMVLSHLCKHAEALSSDQDTSADGEDMNLQGRFILHRELKSYLRRRGIEPADVRKEKELEKANQELAASVAALQATCDKLQDEVKDAFDKGFASGFQEACGVEQHNDDESEADGTR
ncbi:MAG: hypothetical protein SGPRY_003813 [Prymnesium sp.]